MIMADSNVLKGLIEDLTRVQEFDANSLVQKDRLGEMAFFDAVVPANRLINLFRKIPVSSLEEFPEGQQEVIQSQAKAAYSLFSQILNYKMTVSDPEGTKVQFIAQLSGAFQPAFSILFPLISYAVARTVDFASLEARGRAAVQSIDDEKVRILAQIQDTSEQAKQVLTEVREAAAEQGVTQTAKFFATEADSHEKQAKNWLIASSVMAAVVLGYSVATLFLPFWFDPQTNVQSVQLIASKALIFVVLAYGLFQCVRNYSAHRHNFVTNKHRQNALLTYKTLAEAGNSPELRDAVLQHAAAAIYSPNDSGYLKSEERGYGGQSLLALAARNLSTTGSNAP